MAEDTARNTDSITKAANPDHDLQSSSSSGTSSSLSQVSSLQLNNLGHDSNSQKPESNTELNILKQESQLSNESQESNGSESDNSDDSDSNHDKEFVIEGKVEVDSETGRSVHSEDNASLNCQDEGKVEVDSESEHSDDDTNLKYIDNKSNSIVNGEVDRDFAKAFVATSLQVAEERLQGRNVDDEIAEINDQQLQQEQKDGVADVDGDKVLNSDCDYIINEDYKEEKSVKNNDRKSETDISVLPTSVSTTQNDDDENYKNWNEDLDYQQFHSDSHDTQEFSLQQHTTQGGASSQNVGPKFPPYVTEFYSLYLHDEVSRGTQAYGVKKPFDLQCRCLPKSLQWRDCVIQGPAGSGKTVTCVITVLQFLARLPSASELSGVHALVVCPTRELCNAVNTEFQNTSKFMKHARITLLGGVNKKEESGQLKENHPNIVIATPSMVDYHLKTGCLDLSDLNILILEQCDILGKAREFKSVIYKLLKETPQRKQVLLTCTTCPGSLTNVTSEAYENPVDKTKLLPARLRNYYAIDSGDENKNETLHKILNEVKFKQALVFVNSWQKCGDIEMYLKERGLSVGSYHSGVKPISHRDSIYRNFSDNAFKCLITTDVLSTVTCSSNVDLVVNLDPPHEDTAYVYRATRAVSIQQHTDKAVCVTFVSSQQLLDPIEKSLGFKFRQLPGDLTTINDGQDNTAVYVYIFISQ